MHARHSKNFVLEERLERYAAAIELNPRALAGHWAEGCCPLGEEGPRSFREVRLDLGCGKGAFIVESARREPDVLFVGMDYEPICVAFAAQAVCESGLVNAVIVPGTADDVTEFFGAGELAGITLNFSTPFPRKRDAAGRLTHADRLMAYREVLAPGAAITMRTDSVPLYGWSLTQFEAAGYRVVWSSEDTHVDHPELPVTEYEARLCELGAVVHGICAVPGPAPAEVVQTVPMSLVDWLPEDLSTMTYVPYGMEGTVTNLRNQRAKRRRG